MSEKHIVYLESTDPLERCMTQIKWRVDADISVVSVYADLLIHDIKRSEYVMDTGMNIDPHADFIRNMVKLYFTKTVDNLDFVLPFKPDEEPFMTEKNRLEIDGTGVHVSLNWTESVFGLGHLLFFEDANGDTQLKFGTEDDTPGVDTLKDVWNSMSKEDLIAMLLEHRLGITEVG